MPKIRAFFERMSDAKKAAQTLKNMGYKDAQLDMIDRYNEEYSEEINFAGNENAPSLSALVLRSRGHSFDAGKAPLMSANPMVSGMGTYEEIYDLGTQLLVSAEEGKFDEVKKIIAELGGMVK